MVLVAGEAGIGKTRMIREFLAKLHSPAHVMYGTCVPLADSGMPCGPVRDALRSYVRTCDVATLEHLKTLATPELSSIVPELSAPEARSTIPPDSGFAQVRVFELVLHLLEQLAEERPVVLALEDLHWADGSTLALIAFLIRNLRASPVLLCATYRSDELHRRHPLRPWVAEQMRQGVAKLELPRFDRQELADQLEAITGTDPGPDVIENLMASSEGNPFLTEELAAALTRSGRAELPGSLRELLLDRFLRLSEGTVRSRRSPRTLRPPKLRWLVSRARRTPLCGAGRRFFGGNSTGHIKLPTLAGVKPMPLWRPAGRSVSRQQRSGTHTSRRFA
jgi:hypothetical protein